MRSTASRSRAGMFSSAKTFWLPKGRLLEPGRVNGYPIDFRIKAESDAWPGTEIGGHLQVDWIQWGLGCYEHFLSTGEERWLQAAATCGESLLSSQDPSSGCWWHEKPSRHTWWTGAPWASAMAQGEGASLLVRLFLTTGRGEFASAAVRAVSPLLEETDARLLAPLGNGYLPQEFPTVPPSHVLNGAIFCLWGLHDVGVGLKDLPSLDAYAELMESLCSSLGRWDNGRWSLYSLYPRHVVPNVASSFYHQLHIAQLEAAHTLTPDARLEAMAERFRAYSDTGWRSSLAFAQKSAFRLLVPRNSTLAFRMPWGPRRERTPR